MSRIAFDIQPINRFAGTSAAIRRPKEIAFFSYDENHQFRLDDSSLRYYYPPRLGADLSAGFETFRQLDDAADDHLDSLLRTLIAHEQKTGQRCEADFVTWRGMMTKIMAVPFDNFNDFEMNATCFQGTIFIEENHEAKLASREQQMKQQSRPGAPSQEMMSYWGYKFETLCLIPDTWDAVSRDYIENRENEVVSNYAQYCSVVRTGICNASLIIGGEVDAVWDCKPDDKDQPINWVELKTAQDFGATGNLLTFERKLLKFWIQSFLLGVPKIIVGFRSPDGILQRVEELETQKIPGNVKRSGKASWDGNLCINFTASFLAFLKETITSDGVWRIRRRRNSSLVEVLKMEETGYGDILSTEFVEWRQQMAAQAQSQP
ncbi:hypothetical protein W97_05223 [Coniosporium apollinis CBS 100218]|uniref:Decapping nuclease n=1 Tax=Coniosporium apollinis (strain CBS 100218) TaxID=1168221 RepID=R7YWC3_CONA1|nr:uncharacterized protein W97_05223 [Coniosporium apollinis CBS 100218]EON65981.1 hypothetical protein W97_05223 [Coniosporium apollinis CBS 100218]